MPDNEQTKVCPLCAETIKAAAKVCPHCRRSQGRWFVLSRYDVLAIATPLLLVGAIYLFSRVFYQERDFALDRDKILVLDFHFAVAKDRHETNVVVSGVLTNESEHSWDIGDFEIRYLNREGKILNAANSSDGFIVLPHCDHSFSMTLYSLKSVPQFASCKIKVISAEDPRAPLKLFDN
jgi:hypothetical protein